MSALTILLYHGALKPIAHDGLTSTPRFLILNAVRQSDPSSHHEYL